MMLFDFGQLDAAETASRSREVVMAVHSLFCYPSLAPNLEKGIFDFADLEVAELDALESACYADTDWSLTFADCMDPIHSWAPHKLDRVKATKAPKTRCSPRLQVISTAQRTLECRWGSLAKALLRREVWGLGQKRCHLRKKLRRKEQLKDEGVLQWKLAMKRRRCDEPRWGKAFSSEVCSTKTTKANGFRAQASYLFEEPACISAGASESLTTRPTQTPSRWGMLLEALLQREDLIVGFCSIVPRRSSCRRRIATAEQVQRWEYIHGKASVCSNHAVHQRHYELTLAYQHQGEVKLQEKLQEQKEQRCQIRQWRKKWTEWSNRCRLRSVLHAWSTAFVRRSYDLDTGDGTGDVFCPGLWRQESHGLCPNCNRNAAPGYVHCCRTCRDSFGQDHGPRCNAAYGTQNSSHDAEAAAAALGLDVATYRLLRQLEEREIVPEDYELLGSLDAATKPATLNREDLQRFPTERYEARSVNTEAEQEKTVAFGVDFWRLPISLDVADEPDVEQTVEAEKNIFGSPDYWRLPLPKDADESTEEGSEGDSRRCDDELCAICYTEFEDGEAVRRLQPCGHCFHKSCIDRWLLESSTKCPGCNQDVATRW